MVQAGNVEETSKHGVLGRHQTCPKERIQVPSNTIERNHSLQYTPSLSYPESCSDGNWNNQIRESFCVTHSFFQISLLQIIGGKNWVHKLLEMVKTPNKPNQKNKNPIVRTGRLVKSEQPSGSLTSEIEKDVLFGCESTNVSTVRLVKSCVPVFVERSDKDKDNDADENVDADPISTARLVSGQSIGLFAQREDIDIDFRVSGLPHAVVKQAENFRVRELVKKIESHPHRKALQADLQQRGNVALFELCETIPKVQCSESFLYGNQAVIYCTCGHLLVESESSPNFNHWRLDALSIPHYVNKKERLHGARHGKMRHSGSQIEAGIRGKHHPGLNSEFFLL